MKKTTFDDFCNKAHRIHNNRYEYVSITYCRRTFAEILCALHGLFNQRIDHHLSGSGCPICKKESIAQARMSTLHDFVTKAQSIHGNFYSYDESNYISAKSKIVITCPHHGRYEQLPDIHLRGSGCQKCGDSKVKQHHIFTTLTKQEFIDKSVNTHGNFYSYDKVNFVNTKEKVLITCPYHGDFSQKAENHMRLGHGCPLCNAYSKAEQRIFRILSDRKIPFEYQKTFADFRNPKTNVLLRFDFYFPEKNIVLEYDGKQHFEPITYWGGQQNFERIVEHDNLKTEYCSRKNIPLIRITYKENIFNKLKENSLI